MINQRNTAQPNTPTSTNMQFGYHTGPFDLINMQPMQNPSDLYSYYAPGLYQPFGSFDEHNQWSSTDLSGNVPPPPPPGQLSFHPQMCAPSPVDITRSPFDYPSPSHPYPHYHPGFNPSHFSGPSSVGTSAFDMPWNPHSLSMQQHIQVAAAQQPPPMPPIGIGSTSNKKSSVYDEYPSTSSGIGDMLAQHMHTMDLGNNASNQDRHHSTYDNTPRVGVLSSREQQKYQSNPNTSQALSSSLSTGPKSYACVVSSDANNRHNNKSSASMSNAPARSSDQISAHEYTNQSSHFAPDSFHSHFQQRTSGNTTGLYRPNSASSTNARTNYNNSNPATINSDHVANNNNSGRQNYHSARTNNNGPNPALLQNLKRNHQYNPKDFNLTPKGARFFVIKSYSEDDVHRSIKYNIWCSTEHGNKRLDTAFREREGKGPIYLFFSVNASGHFCGMAEMMSPIDYEHQTDVWHMSNKWQGKFEVKWIYVKDVPNQQLRNIRLENNENKPVTNSRDTQEIPYEKGKLMLKTMHMYQDKTSIFDDFHYYESKQVDEVTQNPTINDWKWQEPTSNQDQ